LANESVTAYNPELVCEIDVLELEYQQDLAVRIYQPKGTGPFPALVDVHGGVWGGGDRTNAEVMDRALAESGIVVAAIDFRLAPEHPYPAQVADVNLATRWLKFQASEFHADPHTVGAIGSSSGGHSVLLSAMRPHHPAYNYLDLPGSGSNASLKFVLAAWPIVDPDARRLAAAHPRLRMGD